MAQCYTMEVCHRLMAKLYIMLSARKAQHACDSRLWVRVHSNLYVACDARSAVAFALQLANMKAYAYKWVATACDYILMNITRTSTSHKFNINIFKVYVWVHIKYTDVVCRVCRLLATENFRDMGEANEIINAHIVCSTVQCQHDVHMEHNRC